MTMMFSALPISVAARCHTDSKPRVDADLFQVGGTITGSGSSAAPQPCVLPAIREPRSSLSTGRSIIWIALAFRHGSISVGTILLQVGQRAQLIEPCSLS